MMTDANPKNRMPECYGIIPARYESSRLPGKPLLELAGKPKEALALYKPASDGNQRFKQFIRLAEWAMAAEDMAQAQTPAWDALRSAKLKRDRRYALTVLAESYRRDKQLEKLIERLKLTLEIKRIIGGNGHPPRSILKELREQRQH